MRVHVVSADAEIATLAREAPHDPLARYRWRCALVRAGRWAEAGFEEGDEVSVGKAPPDDEIGPRWVGWVGHDEEPIATLGRPIPGAGLHAIARAGQWGCGHREAWTLITPAKPKVGGE